MGDTLQFAYPALIWIGLLICLAVVYGLVISNRKRSRDLAKLINAKLMPNVTESISDQRRLFRQIIWVSALFCLFIAWARPQYGFEYREIKRKGIDLVFAFDTSQSMLAEDVVPNRLERARIAVTDFIDRLEGDRVALIPFAGKAFSLCPLTLDYAAFQQSLDALDTSIIPHMGTDIATAVAEANRLFDEEKDSHRLLILITDGEDLQGEVSAALSEANKKNMTIHTVGVGSPEGARIPMLRNGYRDFVRDRSGKPVVTSIDEPTLQKIASETGGIYVPLGKSGQGLNQIYSRKLSLVPRQEMDQQLDRVPIERFEWPLIIAIGLLLLEFLISERRKRVAWIDTASRKISKMANTMKPQSIGILLALGLTTSVMGGDKPTDPRATYNQGTTAYREGDYAEADRMLQQSLKETADITLQQKAYYNLGNSRYRIGQKTLKEDPKATIEKWKESLKAFEDALELNPRDRDAEFNREFVAKKLEELEKQQEQQQLDQQDQQDQDQENQEQQDKKDQEQQGKEGEEQEDKEGEEQQDQQGEEQQDQQGEEQQDQQGKEQQDQQGKEQQDQQGEEQQTQNGINEERRAPGEMSKQEAAQLLEALKQDEQTVVPLPNMNQYRRSVPNNTTQGKTW